MIRAITFGVIFCLVSTGIAHAATIYVPDNYASIQLAIDIASNGDTIIVRPGTYMENIDFIGKAITVQSEQGAAVTIINGNQAGSVVNFQSGEGRDSIITGFTITNGWAIEGGGIYCSQSDPTVIDNIIKDNIADSGAGMHLRDSSILISGNSITGNSTTGHGGGGICCASVHITTIHDNIISNNSSTGSGGGIQVIGAVQLTISNNLFYSNSSHKNGGGAINSGAVETITISNNIFCNNDAVGYNAGGGAIKCTGPSVLLNNFIYDNNAPIGGGVLLDSTPIIVNNTICQNTASQGGGGIYCRNTEEEARVINSILWGNICNDGSQIYLHDGSELSLDHSDVDGGELSVYEGQGCTLNWGSNMIDSDPLFVNPDINDFHLTFPSPCLNAGDNYAPNLPSEDIEGDPRISAYLPPLTEVVDMGADELHIHLYCMGSVVPGGSVNINVIGWPGMYPVTLYLGSGIQDPPHSTPYGDLYLDWPPKWQKDIGFIPWNGALTVPATIPLSWNPGDEDPFQALVGPLGGTYSKLTNLMVLEVE